MMPPLQNDDVSKNEIKLREARQSKMKTKLA